MGASASPTRTPVSLLLNELPHPKPWCWIGNRLCLLLPSIPLLAVEDFASPWCVSHQQGHWKLLGVLDSVPWGQWSTFPTGFFSSIPLVIGSFLLSSTLSLGVSGTRSSMALFLHLVALVIRNPLILSMLCYGINGACTPMAFFPPSPSFGHWKLLSVNGMCSPVALFSNPIVLVIGSSLVS